MSTVIATTHIDPDWLAERQRLGHDRFDEMWEGVWHFVSPPNNFHQVLETWLVVHMWPLAQSRGLQSTVETGLFDPTQPTRNFRQPDVVVFGPEHRTHRGAEGGAELVVEIRSPNDETYLKFPFFARYAIPQVLVILPDTCGVELYELDGDGYRVVTPDAFGWVTLTSLGLSLRTGDGPSLVARWEGGSSEIKAE
jgi:Uma2 family endonuclease